MAKLKLDLHCIFNKGDQIEHALQDIMERANEKNAKTVEIIHGKGSGQLKKKVLRFLQQPHIREQYQRVVKDPKNSGRLFIYFKK